MPAFPAVADRSYHVTELANQQKGSKYSTTVTTRPRNPSPVQLWWRTANYERYIVNGVANQVCGFH